ncbi:polysaccharide biosynthesis tyrosine autokinase [Paraburkholderia lycopersici]|uniref:Tyrosine-protein kinase Etk/Wzc n=1 Tax=Paraburkholderia lycopersici TaxID=416944 RepID=A0A1G6XWJ3_9BURK|nr:polysaccharide biosynthesis tyrosine autokinase [Paraburkholderia lycopersici]SDD82539.1 tyrosine-protein kinase Etk/Wzc [Paraburkholderia lycopersici]
MNTPILSHSSDSENQEFKLAVLLDVFIIYRSMMLWIFGIVVVLGLAAVLLSDPVYEADILTQVDESDASTTASSLLGQDIAAMFNVKSSMDTETQVIQSRSVISAAVDSLRLFIDASPARFPIVGNAIARNVKGLSKPGLFGLGGFTWGQERIDVARFDVPDELEGAKFNLTLIAQGKYRLTGPGMDGAAIGQTGRDETFLTEAGPVTLNVASITAHAGARFEISRESRLETINRLQRDISISQQGKDSNVLRVRLRGTDASLIAAILNDIASRYVKQDEARKTEDAERSLKFLLGQVPALREKLDASERAYAEARRTLGSVNVDAEAASALQRSADAETALVQLEQKRAAAAQLYASGHPTIVALDREISVLRGESAALAQRISQLPDTERKIAQTARDVKVNSDLYVGLLNNIEQLQLLRAGRMANVRILDGAVAPDRPMRFRRMILALAVLIFAAFTAICAAWIRDKLYGGISDSREIQRETDLKVASVVPLSRAYRSGVLRRFRTARRTRLLAFADPADPAIESLRSFRTGLQFSMVDASNNIVMFTGPSPSIGKSFISSNVAALIASSGKRVLLVDCDLRRSALSDSFGSLGGTGLSDVIAGIASIEQSVRRIGQSNLEFLSAGSPKKNAGDLLTDPGVAGLFKTLAEIYDVVILDTAPVLPVSDAETLAPLAKGNVFLVARAGTTRIAELEECERRLGMVEVEVNGVILNGIDPRAGHFRYGIRYGTYKYGRAEQSVAGGSQ